MVDFERQRRDRDSNRTLDMNFCQLCNEVGHRVVCCERFVSHSHLRASVATALTGR
jgi:hypothetical protein